MEEALSKSNSPFIREVVQPHLLGEAVFFQQIRLQRLTVGGPSVSLRSVTRIASPVGSGAHSETCGNRNTKALRHLGTRALNHSVAPFEPSDCSGRSMPKVLADLIKETIILNLSKDDWNFTLRHTQLRLKPAVTIRAIREG
ncbi:MAG: hypothetical protein AMJ88_10005 [Anaerolineae bacterium SM23_ 63]|nr:MAG: hypothetical protein AMJ88_10005 [Anaerolineae bacterium SM23_ 63]